jgi:hypothetical protein
MLRGNKIDMMVEELIKTFFLEGRQESKQSECESIEISYH